MNTKNIKLASQLHDCRNWRFKENTKHYEIYKKLYEWQLTVPVVLTNIYINKSFSDCFNLKIAFPIAFSLTPLYQEEKQRNSKLPMNFLQKKEKQIGKDPPPVFFLLSSTLTCLSTPSQMNSSMRYTSLHHLWWNSTVCSYPFFIHNTDL